MNQNPSVPSAPTGESGASGHTTLRDDLSETQSRFAETARDTTAKVKSAVSHTTARAREETARMAAEKKEMAAQRLGSFSSAIHESARSLEQDDPNIAWFTHRAADRLQGVADYVRNRDFADLRYDAESLARRHPLAFFGGLFVAGLVLGNVVKASQRKSRSDERYASETDDENDWAPTSPAMGSAASNDLSAEARTAAGI
jgi:hypothetical protein